MNFYRAVISICAALQTFLLFGKSGWIGGLVGELLRQQGARFEFASARLEDRAGVVADIERVSPLRAFKAAVSKILLDQKQIASTCPCLAQVRPTHVLNAAGLTGRPNVDWCEDHKVRYRASSCLKQSLWRLQACHNSCWLCSVVLSFLLELARPCRLAHARMQSWQNF